MNNMALTSIIGLALAGLLGTGGQLVGDDLCACTPSTYEFTLDFGLSCPPVNVTESDAVDETSCVITPFGDPNVTDLVPVSVESIDILELGQGLRVLVQENIKGEFSDGDKFQYVSLSATPEAISDSDMVPRAIQVNIVGLNQFNESLINVYIITFTNDCDTFPVLFEGQSAGWTEFTRLEPPLREVCPFGTTDSPTLSPTMSITLAPSPSTTLMPSVLTPPPASLSPTPAPAVTVLPTLTPIATLEPSPAPIHTAIPTLSPPVATASPTPAPFPVTSKPTTVPTMATAPPVAMSMSMSMNLELQDMDLLQEFGLAVPKSKEPSRAKRAKKSKTAKTAKSSGIQSSSKDSKDSKSSGATSSPKQGKKRRQV